MLGKTETNPSRRSSFEMGSLVLLAIACGPQVMLEELTQGSSSTTSPSRELDDGGHGSTRSTSDGDGGSIDASPDDETGPPATTTSSVDADSSSTGPVIPRLDVPGACEAWCGAVPTCFPDVPFTHAECVADCIEDAATAVREFGPHCEGAFIELYGCAAQARCPIVQADLACLPEQDYFESECQPPPPEPCVVSAQDDGEAGCGAWMECGLGIQHVMYCDVVGCMCYEAGETVGYCELEDACVELGRDGLPDFAAFCCGWMF